VGEGDRPGALSPAIGFLGAFLLMLFIYRVFFRLAPGCRA